MDEEKVGGRKETGEGCLAEVCLKRVIHTIFITATGGTSKDFITIIHHHHFIYLCPSTWTLRQIPQTPSLPMSALNLHPFMHTNMVPRAVSHS